MTTLHTNNTVHTAFLFPVKGREPCWLFILLLSICMAMSMRAAASSIAEPDIPLVLKPWKEWVLYGEDSRKCPAYFQNAGQRQCYWPGRLQLEVGAEQARFQWRWTVIAESWVTLPGDAVLWPAQVMVNGRSTPVVDRNGRPSLYLEPGEHRVQGLLEWQKRPEFIQLPDTLGLMGVRYLGQPIQRPDVDPQGRLWLARQVDRAEHALPEQDRLSIQVFRKLQDRVPMWLETLVKLDVAGSDREIVTGRALPDGFEVVELQAPIPVRIDENGQLRAQVRPGQWQIRLQARALSNPLEFRAETQSSDWPKQELWAIQTYPELRQVEFTGVAKVDTSQTLMPAQWKGLPAYVLSPGQLLSVQEQQRGDEFPSANDLQLQRKMWLQPGGRQWVVQDRIQGRMHRDWRLTLQQPLRLEHVESRQTPQLINRLIEDADTGFELRDRQLDVQTVAQMPVQQQRYQMMLPVSAWQSYMSTVATTAYLPPGWRILGATGIENIHGDWISRWQIWDLFVVLLITVAIAKTTHFVWAMLAFPALVMSYFEPMMPLWIWLNLTIVLALDHVIHGGMMKKLLNIYRYASYFTLFSLLLAFSVNQVRFSIYPHLEYEYRTTPGMLDQMQEMVLPEAMDMPMEADMAMEARSKAMPMMAAPAPERAQPQYQVSIDPLKDRVLTGPAIPAWQGAEASLHWQSVDADMQFRLYVLTPTQLCILRITSMVLLLLTAVGFLLRLPNGREPTQPRDNLDMTGSPEPDPKGNEPVPSAEPSGKNEPEAGSHSSASPSLIVTWLGGLVIGLMAAFSPSQTVANELPSSEMLAELKKRLIVDAPCYPHCATVNQSELVLDGFSLTLTLMIDALSHTFVPLPSASMPGFPGEVYVDGRPSQTYFFDDSKQLNVPLEEGSHEVVLIADVKEMDQLDIRLPMPLHGLRMNIQDWLVAGYRDGRLLSDALQFTRKQVSRRATEERQTLFPDAPKAYVKVERRIQLGLDWRVQTRVTRIAPDVGTISLDIPLLAGEVPTSDAVLHRDGRAQVILGQQQRQISWQSILPISDMIELVSESSSSWDEVWQVDVGSTWRLSYEGLAPVKSQQYEPRWVPVWQPRSGERLALKLTRAESIDGETLTIDRGSLRYQPGKNVTEASLQLDVRNSLGERLSIGLSPKANLGEIWLNHQPYPVVKRQDYVDIQMPPGENSVQLQWQEPSMGVFRWQPQPVRIAPMVYNLDTEVVLPSERWLLLTQGSLWRGVVLYWGWLPVIILFALVLGWHRQNPLRVWQWLLLGLGLSLAVPEVYAIVVVWFYALYFRKHYFEHMPTDEYQQWSGKRWSFRWMQISLIVLSVVAVSAIMTSIPQGLMGTPDMHVAGQASTANHVRWYHAQIKGELPDITLYSLSMWYYRGVMLLWSLWLAVALVSWLRWAWQCLAASGVWQLEPQASRQIPEIGLPEDEAESLRQ